MRRFLMPVLCAIAVVCCRPTSGRIRTVPSRRRRARGARVGDVHHRRGGRRPSDRLVATRRPERSAVLRRALQQRPAGQGVAQRFADRSRRREHQCRVRRRPSRHGGTSTHGDARSLLLLESRHHGARAGAIPSGPTTEWYPPAVVSQAAVSAATLRNPNESSVIEWPSVRVSPTAQPAFPLERGASHYYAARSTDAAPLSVGDQHERFLFYRGVADFDASLSAAVDGDGRIVLKNVSDAEIPAVVLFERRGARLGFRVVGRLSGDRTVAPPSLDGSFDDLRSTLFEQTLVANGLTAREA